MTLPALRLTIQGENRFDGLPSRPTLRRWILSALAHDADITLRFVDGVEGRSLNRRFRGIDRSTNVLTFVYALSPRVSADIALCVPKIWREARERGKPAVDHLAHLVIHGALHAQGHQHDSRRQGAAMEAREVAILRALGFGDPYKRNESNR